MTKNEKKIRRIIRNHLYGHTGLNGFWNGFYLGQIYVLSDHKFPNHQNFLNYINKELEEMEKRLKRDVVPK